MKNILPKIWNHCISRLLESSRKNTFAWSALATSWGSTQSSPRKQCSGWRARRAIYVKKFTRRKELRSITNQQNAEQTCQALHEIVNVRWPFAHARLLRGLIAICSLPLLSVVLKSFGQSCSKMHRTSHDQCGTTFNASFLYSGILKSPESIT